MRAREGGQPIRAVLRAQPGARPKLDPGVLADPDVIAGLALGGESLGDVESPSRLDAQPGEAEVRRGGGRPAWETLD